MASREPPCACGEDSRFRAAENAIALTGEQSSQTRLAMASMKWRMPTKSRQSGAMTAMIMKLCPAADIEINANRMKERYQAPRGTFSSDGGNCYFSSITATPPADCRRPMRADAIFESNNFCIGVREYLCRSFFVTTDGMLNDVNHFPHSSSYYIR